MKCWPNCRLTAPKITTTISKVGPRKAKWNSTKRCPPPGRYLVRYRFSKNGRVVSVGHGFEAQL